MTSPINSIKSGQLIELLSKFFGGNNFLQADAINQVSYDYTDEDDEYGMDNNPTKNTNINSAISTENTSDNNPLTTAQKYNLSESETERYDILYTQAKAELKTAEYELKQLEASLISYDINAKDQKNKQQELLALKAKISILNTRINNYANLLGYDTDNIQGNDYNALYVEGKGYNINNLISSAQYYDYTDKNLEFKASKDGFYTPKWQDLYKNGTIEEKAALEKIFKIDENGNIDSAISSLLDVDPNTLDENSYIMKKGAKDQSFLRKIARYDKNNDGFLSEDEIKFMQDLAEDVANLNDCYKVDQLKEDKTKAVKNKLEQAGYLKNCDKTTVNGKMVYFSSVYDGNTVQTIALTDDELEIYDKYFSSSEYKKVDGENMDKLMNELNAVNTSGTSHYSMINSAGIISNFWFKPKGACNETTYRQWTAYQNAKKAYLSDNNV